MTDHGTALHLRLRHLQLVKFLKETGTVGEAATLMNRTQPALTKMLQELENALGVRLFDRGRQGARITAEGEAFLRRATVILNEWGQLEEDLDAASSARSQTIRLGSTPMTSLGILPHALRSFRAAWPDVRVRLQEASMYTLILALEAGEVDLVIGRYSGEGARRPELLGLWQERLYEERLSVIAGRDSALAGAEPPGWAELAAADWVLPPKELRTRSMLETEFLRAGHAPPRPVYETSSFATAIAFAQQLGVLALVPFDAASYTRHLGLVSIVRSRLGEFPAPISILRRANTTDLPALEALTEALRTSGDKYSLSLPPDDIP